jgi:uncharacterized membrane protein YkgB
MLRQIDPQIRAAIVIMFFFFGYQKWWVYNDWLFGALLFAGFWDKRLGILGAARSTSTFIATVTIISPHAGRLGRVRQRISSDDVPFLIKDVVLLAVSLYLLKLDVARVAQP